MNRILDIGYPLQLGNNEETFIIKDILGKGASSVTYLAECNQTEHVLKECNPLGLHMHRDDNGTLVSDTDLNKTKFDEYLARFADGANKQLAFRMTETLKNSTSNVQKIYHANGTTYIDMTYFKGCTYDKVENESLFDLLRRMRSIAKVVGGYHDMGYLHLDIKPQNIYAIPETPEMVMMFDFDSVVPEADVEKTVLLSYTDSWAAPEQKMAKYRKSICKATDLFAIGEMIFYRIMGRHSNADEHFDFSTYAYDMDARIFKNVNPKVFKKLDELFHKTICCAPINRLQNAEDLIDLLDETIPLAYSTYNGLLSFERNNYQMKLQSYVDDNPYKKDRHNFLYEVMCEINGIGEDIYKDDQKKTRILDVSEFEQKSLLEWTKKDTYDCTSYLFRCRFLTIFLSDFLKKADNIIVNRSSCMYNEQTDNFDATYGDILQIYDDMQYFVKNILSEASHSNIIHKINQYCNYKKLSDNHVDVNNFINDLLLELKNGLKKSIHKPRELLDADAISKIYRLAFILCTGKSTSELTAFQMSQKVNVQCELRKYTELLGKSIVEACEYIDRPLLYLAYNKARPNIWSKYKDINSNIYISVGVRALEYTKFYCNDKSITQFISKML